MSKKVKFGKDQCAIKKINQIWLKLETFTSYQTFNSDSLGTIKATSPTFYDVIMTSFSGFYPVVLKNV